MVDSTRRQRLNLPVAPLVAAVIGGVIALVFALIPTGLLEDLVIDSGIAAVIPAAEPPLGVTARAVLILAAGGGTALIAWFGLFLLLGDRAIVVQKSASADGDEAAPVLRRADAHPDAPARRPLSANRELGTPFLEVRAHRPVHTRADEPEIDAEFDELPVEEPVERDLPADLDMPLAAYDPKAIPEEPIDWAPQTAPLLRTPRQQVFDPGERFETFELTPLIRRATPAPVIEPEPEPEPVAVRAPIRVVAPPPVAEPIEAYAPPPAPIYAPEPIQPSRPVYAPEPIQITEPVYAPAPIAAPEPMPAFAPTEAREPEPAPETPYAPVPIVTPEPMPSFAPTPSREPAQFFRTKSPFRPEAANQDRSFAPARPRASAQVEMDPSASIHALLDRLERGVGRRETIAPPPPPQNEDSLQEALVTLRRLAMRG
ncbi:MAG: hypothetical protein WC729_24700 [Sphingomonas sp.]|jgi:hypothetical protein|uniref:hypothetical protein n=1 Tax=Sphingomonas sp. TaxID=28214 RepID=UPI00356A07B4